MTPRSLSVVVVGGAPDDGGRQDAFEVAVDGADVRAATEQAAATVGAIAASHGRRPRSIGVTWSDEADAEASLLMASLTESGFGNVVPIRLPEATEALARGMADAIGFRTSAVCVLEPATAIALIVHTGDGAVQTAINHTIDSDESLIGWLSTVFTRADWQPEALVLVGSAGGFDTVLPRLQEALSVPVFAPVDAPLALARGAALASTQGTDLPLDTGPFTAVPGGGRYRSGRRRPSPSKAFAGLLVAGVLTFVVSASVAVAAQLSPRQQPADPRPVVTAERISRPAPPSRAPVPAPPPEAPVIAEPAEAVAPIAEPVPPPVEAVPVLDASPAQLPVELPAQMPVEAPAVLAPPPVAPPPVVSPVYEPPKKPLLQRIRDRLRLGGDDQGPPAVIRPPSMG